MSLVRYLYSRLADLMLEKLGDMKMVKLPTFVDNYSFLKFMGIAERAKNGKPLYEPLGSTLNFKDFQELMFLPNLFPLPDGTPLNKKVIIGKKAKTNGTSCTIYDSSYGLWSFCQQRSEAGIGSCISCSRYSY